ncbi:MAG: ABC transporter ATP-binding protein [Spirochaetes bacterium]|nr:ABC transporter ATP-binding protein [Spirochaetota bacterium]
MKSKRNKIVINNLSFGYNLNQPVLKDINLQIKEKEIVTIIGPNGGGKTTLLRLILGLLKPDTGTIFIDGKPPRSAQKNIGYVPQQSSFDKKFPITVSDVVLSGRIKTFGYYSKKDKAKATESLEEVGLSGIETKPFFSLSGGQQQRVLIARALSTDTDLLLLDEPTSNVDPSTGRNMNSLLKRLNDRLTIVLVSHDTGFVANITQRVLCINKTVVEHPIDEQFSNIIASSYSGQSMIVRHDSHLTDPSSEKDTGNE